MMCYECFADARRVPSQRFAAALLEHSAVAAVVVVVWPAVWEDDPRGAQVDRRESLQKQHRQATAGGSMRRP